MSESIQFKTGMDIEFCHIPSGPFIYGPEECYERLAQCPPFKARQTMDLPEFWIAQYPVTYSQWRQFLEATGYRWHGRWYKVIGGFRGTFLRAYAPSKQYPDSHDTWPIVDVSQADAYEFCGWLSAKMDLTITLPTEYQWEKAARGTDGRIYPWGYEKPRPEIQWQKKFPVGPETYLYTFLVKPRREWARGGLYWRNGYPLSVGSIPENVSPYGCLDMSGNIWEWTSSLYNPDLPDFHVVKGGSWGYTIHHVKCNVRSACSVTTPSQNYRAHGTGFRVIYNLN